MIKLITTLAIVLLLNTTKTSAQCDTMKLIDDTNVSYIDLPSQLAFIHNPPLTNVDYFFAQLLTLQQKDSAEIVRLIDAIGATRSEEAYCLLYTACCRPIFIKDLNPFNGFQGTITYYGGYNVLNKYFLNGLVDEGSDHLDFANAVILECRKNEPKCYYCKPEDEMLKYKRELSMIDTRYYDNEIIRVINDNSSLIKYGGIQYFGKALDSIVWKLESMVFVGEALWDRCDKKELLYGQYTIGVIIMIDEKPVEKCYTIQVGEIENPDKLFYTGNFIDPGFIYRQVDLCDPNRYSEE